MSDVPNSESSVKDFSRKRKQIRFRVDDDVFEAAPAIPAEVLTQFVVKFSDVDNLPVLQRVEALAEVLKMILKPESFSRFRERMSDPESPIDIDQLNDVIEWLMEQYGQRPTQPSQVLQGGQSSPESGKSLTENSSVLVSTFNP